MMNLKSIRNTGLGLGLALLLAACGTSEPGPGGPGPGEPQPGEPGTISGYVYAAPGAGLYDVTVRLCDSGADCSNPSDGRASRVIDSGASQAPFEFRNVPEGTYSIYAYGPTFDGTTTPPSEYRGYVAGIPAGTSNVNVQLEFVVADPSDGTAALTGVLYLPGSLGSASVTYGQFLTAGVEAVTEFTATAQSASDGLILSSMPSLNRSASPAARPGEVVVIFEDDLVFSQSALGTLRADGVQLMHVQGTPGGQHLYEAGQLDLAETLQLAEELRQQPGIKSAAPNWILHSFATPNDALYPIQWHMDAINMPAAWDIQRSSAGVTVAVLDTGSINHSDLRFTGGHNFVSEGSGRSSNPIDPGRGTDYHGAHVAGTIGARTNNSIGVAGMSWNVPIVPVRVLGNNGEGTFMDILDGATWAAGGTVSGAPANPNPARVLNLSLGASIGVSCRDAMGGNDSFFTDLAANGVITVVAAGNEGQNTSGVFPANCPGVITVGATGVGTTQAPYSNYGTAVDVMAPGGDMSASFRVDGRNYAYGVLSTVLGPDGSEGYSFSQGTSMAAPHVSGLVALMLAVDPNLSLSQVTSILRNNTSSPVCGSGCGAGLIDAARTLASMSAGTPPPPAPEPPPTGNDAVTYLVLYECSNANCGSFTGTYYYVDFTNVPVGGVRYMVYGIPAGTYVLESWLDLDDSSNPAAGVIVIEPEDPQYEYPGLLQLQPNHTTTGIDLRLDGSVAP